MLSSDFARVLGRRRSYRQGEGFSEVEGFKIPCAAITLRAGSSFQYKAYLDCRHGRSAEGYRRQPFWFHGSPRGCETKGPCIRGFRNRKNVGENELKIECQGDLQVMRGNPPSQALRKASYPARENPSSIRPSPCTHSTCSSLQSGLPPQLPKSVSTPAQGGRAIHRHEAQRDKTTVSHRVPAIVHASRFILISLNEPSAGVHYEVDLQHKPRDASSVVESLREQ